MHVKISKDDIIEASTDSRGRVYLGSQYADCEVELAILAEPIPKGDASDSSTETTGEAEQ